MGNDDSLLTLPAMARVLRVPQTWLRNEADAGRVPALRAGARFLFSRSAVENALLERAATGKEAAHDAKWMASHSPQTEPTDLPPKKPAKLLDGFLDFWNRKVRDGRLSPLDRCEVLVLEAFQDWIDEQEHIAPVSLAEVAPRMADLLQAYFSANPTVHAAIRECLADLYDSHTAQDDREHAVETLESLLFPTEPVTPG